MSCPPHTQPPPPPYIRNKNSSVTYYYLLFGKWTPLSYVNVGYSIREIGSNNGTQVTLHSFSRLVGTCIDVHFTS